MEKEKCSFCRKSIPHVELVIASGISNKRICSSCVKTATALTKDKPSEKVIDISDGFKKQ